MKWLLVALAVVPLVAFLVFVIYENIRIVRQEQAHERETNERLRARYTHPTHKAD